MTDPVEIEIFGRTYRVRGEKDAAYTRRLAAYVDEQMRAVADRSPPSASPTQIAVLALLHVAHELFEARDELKQRETTIEQEAASLIDLLDASLGESR